MKYGDLISRQAAIDALNVRVMIGRANGKSVAFKIANDYADIVKKRIEALPSAQPYTDKELQKIQDLEQSQFDKVYELGYQAGCAAQPEIIRCKDCQWKNNHNCTRAVEVWIDDDKYCAWAERREE